MVFLGPGSGCMVDSFSYLLRLAYVPPPTPKHQRSRHNSWPLFQYIRTRLAPGPPPARHQPGIKFSMKTGPERLAARVSPTYKPAPLIGTEPLVLFPRRPFPERSGTANGILRHEPTFTGIAQSSPTLGVEAKPTISGPPSLRTAPTPTGIWLRHTYPQIGQWALAGERMGVWWKEWPLF